MPLYDYKCARCGKVSEVRHGFNEAWNEPCRDCGGTVARVFNPAPIVFKGSGFYVTDSRKGNASKPASAPAAETKTAETTTETKSETPASSEAKKSDTKPAEPAA